MRAYHLTGAPADALERHDHDPEPGDPPPGQVVVRIRAASLNYRDLMIARGLYALSASPGRVPLCDGAGEIVAVGDGVRRVHPGERVTTTYFLDWADGTLTPERACEQFGATHDGVLADYLVCGEQSLVRAPEHLSDIEAATLPCSALTAWSALTGPRPVLPGQTILTLGTGGVSLFAVQLAGLFGAQVIAATSTPEKARILTDLGAQTVLNYREHPDWDTAVLDLTDGRGADRVVETVGPETLERSLRATAFGGEVAHVGGGGFSGDGAAVLDPTVLHGRSLTLRRVTVGSRAAFDEMNRAIAAHRLHPVIDQRFDFGEAPAAYRRLEDRVHVGKVVIAVS